jgi:predicted acylesterase/phospholipase RssA
MPGTSEDSAAGNAARSSRARWQNPDALRAERILGGEERPDTEGLATLAETLIKQTNFGLARRVLAIARETDRQSVRLAQRHALCTYKDPDLPAQHRLDAAFEILREVDPPPASGNQETLGLAGAIFKNRWAISGQKEHLERSLAFYLRGYELGVGDGYTGINAAFVLDQLAAIEQAAAREIGGVTNLPAARREQARAIRGRIVEVLQAWPNPPQEWWFQATLAEALFGLGRYEEAAEVLRAARRTGQSSWEHQSSVRQLAALARLHGAMEREDSPAWTPLRVLLPGENAEQQRHVLRALGAGKLGLALSGGGFRASLYHIGVLARLAELDVLRHVEAISCVSGGSIIGAHFYLELRRLLERLPDEEIDRAHYVELVQKIEREFLAGVQENIRTRLARDWRTNLRLLFERNFSRTSRLGELYDELLFSVADPKTGPDGNAAPHTLEDLLVHPAGEPGDFSPRADNWRRAAKIPDLILNATTVNTGHNWQFTATWMGEPASRINTEVDGNERLRRMYHWQAPPAFRQVPLGAAVAASSCVPALFDPVVLRGLYPGRVVRLVDGGVHDNQGLDSLLEQQCSLLLVSDASGQTAAEPDPGAELWQVFFRVNNLLMARVREAQYAELRELRNAGLLRGLMFIHLKKELGVHPVDWIGCSDPKPNSPSGNGTSYGIARDVQEQLARVRTDLDSFSDQEACALMLSGYRMTAREFPSAAPNLAAEPAAPVPWRFLAMDAAMRGEAPDPKARESLLRLLSVSGSLAGKIWQLDPQLATWAGRFRKGLALIGVVLTGGLGWGLWRIFDRADGAEKLVVLTLAVVAVCSLFLLAGAFLCRRCRGKTRSEAAAALCTSTAGWPLAALHLRCFDKRFLAAGRLPRKADL